MSNLDTNIYFNQPHKSKSIVYYVFGFEYSTNSKKTLSEVTKEVKQKVLDNLSTIQQKLRESGFIPAEVSESDIHVAIEYYNVEKYPGDYTITDAKGYVVIQLDEVGGFQHIVKYYDF